MRWIANTKHQQYGSKMFNFTMLAMCETYNCTVKRKKSTLQISEITVMNFKIPIRYAIINNQEYYLKRIKAP